MRVAAIQMAATLERDRNLEVAQVLVERAAAQGAELVVLPEIFDCTGKPELMVEHAVPFDGPVTTWASSLAKQHGIWFVAGSFSERLSHDRHIANTSTLFDPSGDLVATYRKLHLFDITVPGAQYYESETVRAGDDIVTADLDGHEARLGMSICYDLRFPELYRALAVRGADIVSAPSAFTARTGEAHWELLVRARAVEEQVAMIAPNQYGPRFFGHSLIADSWGRVLAGTDEAADEIVIANIDLDEQRKIRQQLPSVANRRADVYGTPGA